MRIRYSLEELRDQVEHRKRRLTASERRKVIAYYDATDRVAKKNREYAELFGCSESQASRDRRRVIMQAANELTPERAAEFIQEFLRDIDSLIKQTQDALGDITSVPVGSLTHIQYMKLLESLLERRMTKLQQIGVVKNDLGTLNVREEVWQASVAPDTGVVTSQKLSADEAAALPPETSGS